MLDGDGSANGRYNSQQSMDVQCIQRWIRPIRLKLTKFGCHFAFNTNGALVRTHLAGTEVKGEGLIKQHHVRADDRRDTEENTKT